MAKTTPIFRAFAKTELVPLDVIKGLTNFNFDDPVISFYLNLTPDIIKKRTYISRFKSLVKNAKEQQKEYIESLTRSQRQTLEADLKEILEFLENEFKPDGLRTLVIFKSGRQLKLALHLPAKLYSADKVTIDADIYTLPLLALYYKNPKALVVHVAKDQARFYRLHLGIFEHIRDLHISTYPISSIPLKDKLQSKLNAHMHRFFKEIVRDIVNMHIDEHFNKIIVAGTEATVQRFIPIIPDYLQKRVIGQIYLPAEFKLGELKQQAINTLNTYLRSQEQHQLQVIETLYNKGELLYGVKAILEAQNMFLLKKLWIDSNTSIPGYVCTKDHYLALQEGRCPICDSQLQKTDNVLDELTEIAINYHIDMFTFDLIPHALQKFDGVVGITY